MKSVGGKNELYKIDVNEKYKKVNEKYKKVNEKCKKGSQQMSRHSKMVSGRVSALSPSVCVSFSDGLVHCHCVTVCLQRAMYLHCYPDMFTGRYLNLMDLYTVHQILV